jgi:hypothetical protein
MKSQVMAFSAAAVLLLPISEVYSQSSGGSLGFHASSVSGFPTGEVFLTGGGDFDPATGFLKTGGGFRCLADIDQGPLSGCKAGEGVRWVGAQLLPSTSFKCSGSAAELLKTVVTDHDTIVMEAEFYRQQDGVRESFRAKMFISAVDEAPDLPGVQNIWIQGVGCGEATVHLH